MIILFLDDHNNVLIFFFKTCRNVWLNMNGNMREQEQESVKDAHAFTNDLLSTSVTKG